MKFDSLEYWNILCVWSVFLELGVCWRFVCCRLVLYWHSRVGEDGSSTGFTLLRLHLELALGIDIDGMEA